MVGPSRRGTAVEIPIRSMSTAWQERKGSRSSTGEMLARYVWVSLQTIWQLCASQILCRLAHIACDLTCRSVEPLLLLWRICAGSSRRTQSTESHLNGLMWSSSRWVKGTPPMHQNCKCIYVKSRKASVSHTLSLGLINWIWLANYI